MTLLASLQKSCSTPWLGNTDIENSNNFVTQYTLYRNKLYFILKFANVFRLPELQLWN
jgi:hypothetical protein